MKKFIATALVAFLFTATAAQAGEYLGKYKWESVVIYERTDSYPVNYGKLTLAIEKAGGLYALTGASEVTFDNGSTGYNACYGAGYKTVTRDIYFEGTCGPNDFSMFLNPDTLDGEMWVLAGYDFDFGYAYGYVTFLGKQGKIDKL